MKLILSLVSVLAIIAHSTVLSVPVASSSSTTTETKSGPDAANAAKGNPIIAAAMKNGAVPDKVTKITETVTFANKGEGASSGPVPETAAATSGTDEGPILNQTAEGGEEGEEEGEEEGGGAKEASLGLQSAETAEDDSAPSAMAQTGGPMEGPIADDDASPAGDSEAMEAPLGSQPEFPPVADEDRGSSAGAPMGASMEASMEASTEDGGMGASMKSDDMREATDGEERERELEGTGEAKGAGLGGPSEKQGDDDMMIDDMMAGGGDIPPPGPDDEPKQIRETAAATAGEVAPADEAAPADEVASADVAAPMGADPAASSDPAEPPAAAVPAPGYQPAPVPAPQCVAPPVPAPAPAPAGPAVPEVAVPPADGSSETSAWSSNDDGTARVQHVKNGKTTDSVVPA